MLAEKPWKPDLVVRLLAGIFASMILGVFIVWGYESLTSSIEGQHHRDLFQFSVSVLTLQGVALVLVNLFVREHGLSWSEAFGFREPRLGRTLFLAVIVTVMAFPIALSLLELSMKFLRYFGVPLAPQEAVRITQNSGSVLELVFHGFTTILLVPFVEELVFRGILYPAIKRNGHPSLAMWGTSFFFALLHISSIQTAMIILPLTFLAIILTFLYETTGNLLAPIVTHSLFNAANFAYLVYQRIEQGGL